MVILPIKAISTNRLWGGKKWLTDEGKRFKRDATLLIKAKQLKLKNYHKTETLTIHFRFGLSRDMDVSNAIKALEDCVADALGIDDIIFRGLTATKEKVAKGKEFIAFDIRGYDESLFLPSPQHGKP